MVNGRTLLQRAYADRQICVEPTRNRPCCRLPVTHEVTHPEYGTVHYCTRHLQTDPWADGLAKVKIIRP